MIFDSFNKILEIIDLKTKRLILLVFLSSIFSIFFEALSIGMVIPLISAVTDPQYFSKFPLFKDLTNHFMDDESYQGKIFFLLIVIIIIFSFKILFIIIHTLLKLKLVHDFNLKLQKTLFSKYLDLSWSQYLEKKSSKMIRNIQNETSIIKNKIVDSLITLFAEVLLFFSIVLLLIFTIPKITLGILSVIILIGVLTYKIMKKKIVIYSIKRLSSGAKIFNYIIESLQSFKDIYIYNKQDFFKKKYYEQSKIFHNVQKNIGWINSLPRIFLEALGYFAIITVIYISIRSNLEKQQLITTLGLFLVAITRLIPTVSKLVVAIQKLDEGQIALENIYNEVKEKNTIGNFIKSNFNYDEQDFNESIELKNIKFTYPGKEESIIENLNFILKKNTSNAIYGPSGVGKSTIIDIVSGLHHPESGQIFIDDKLNSNIKDFWKNKISYVGQKNYLFSGNLLTNITLKTDPSKDDISEVRKILDFCNLNKFDIDSKINEMGMNLSGGEGQRISIARALFNEPSFLIFDEATNSLDKETEKEILNLLISLKRKITLLLISHDKNVVNYCDNIFELRNKKLEKIK